MTLLDQALDQAPAKAPAPPRPRRLALVRRLVGGGRAALAENVAARVVALVSLGAATVVVARTGGPTLVGTYALLRVLPGLAGVLLSCGLPGAVTYFLAGTDRDDPWLRSTIIALLAVGGLAGGALWVAGTPLLHRAFFSGMSLQLVALTAITVPTQLWLSVGRSCLQGGDDLRGANIVTALEEAAFLPAYALLALTGISGPAMLVLGLVTADVTVAGYGWARLARRDRRWLRCRGPEVRLARAVVSYGTRGQVGGVLSLLNLRLDFVLLGGLAGPAVLGSYAVASKFAELLRLPSLAATYVLYPKFVRHGERDSARQVRALLPRSTALTVVAGVPLAASAAVLLPLLYGAQFHSAIVPAYVLVAGLVGEGVVGIVTPYLYGIGRPGLCSLAMGAGVVVTVALDLALIPAYGALGAAAASSLAYLTTTAAMFGFFRRVSGTRGRPVSAQTVGGV